MNLKEYTLPKEPSDQIQVTEEVKSSSNTDIFNFSHNVQSQETSLIRNHVENALRERGVESRQDSKRTETDDLRVSSDLKSEDYMQKSPDSHLFPKTHSKQSVEKLPPKDKGEELEGYMNYLVDRYDDAQPDPMLEDLILELNTIAQNASKTIPDSFRARLDEYKLREEQAVQPKPDVRKIVKKQKQK